MSLSPRWLALVPLCLTTLATAVAPAQAATPKPLTVLIELGVKGSPPGAKPNRGPFSIELVIGRDGRWLAGNEMGTLDPKELADLKAQLRATRLVLAKGAPGPCTTGPLHTYRLRTSRGNLVWSTCSRAPGPGVNELVVAARMAIGRGPVLPPYLPPHEPSPIPPEERPTPEPTPAPEPIATAPAAVLVSYAEMSMTTIELDQDVLVRTDGTWSARGTTGVLSAPELAELRRAVAAARTPTPPDKLHRMECAARLEGEGTLAIADGPTYRFSLPCGRPQGTVGDLLARLWSIGRQAPKLPRFE